MAHSEVSNILGVEKSVPRPVRILSMSGHFFHRFHRKCLQKGDLVFVTLRKCLKTGNLFQDFAQVYEKEARSPAV
jgi:hypothetical protein